MSVEIIYEAGLVTSTIAQIESQVQDLLVARTEQYNEMMTMFTNSRGKITEEIKEYLWKEKQIILELAAFYQTMLDMIYRASRDLEQVETTYTKKHINNRR